MRRGLRYGVLVLSALLGLCAAAVALGSFVRSRVAAEAARYHVEVTIGAVRPAWLGVRLVDVAVRPVGVEGVAVRVGEVWLEPGRARRADARGVSVTLVGTPEELRERLADWRKLQRPPASGGGGPGRSSGFTVESMTVSWADSPNATPRLMADDVGVAFDGAMARIAVGTGTFRVGTGALVFEHGVAAVDSNGDILDIHATTASVEWSPPDTRTHPPVSGLDAGAGKGPTSFAGDPPGEHAPPDATVGSPLLPLPDLRRAWGLGIALGQRLTGALSVGSALRVDAFTWRVTPSVGIPFTVGPGPLTGERTDSTIELRFSTGQE